MAAINQQEAARFTDLEWLDNGIEFALKFFTKIAEVILLIGVGYAGYKLAHRGPSNETLDQVWIVSQILALDLSAPGLFAMAKQAQENGQVERASWARRIAGRNATPFPAHDSSSLCDEHAAATRQAYYGQEERA